MEAWTEKEILGYEVLYHIKGKCNGRRDLRRNETGEQSYDVFK